jgi:membrane protein DedA with SNARE-associated domain
MVRGFFERFGRWTLVFGYLVPGVRNVAGLSAGASRLRLKSFAPYAFAGAVISSVICVSFGYIFGPQAEWIFISIQRNLVLALIAGLSIWFVRRRFRQLSPQQGTEPGDAC